MSPSDRWGSIVGGPLLSLVVAAALGYVCALPVLIWHRRDLRSFRRALWVGYGSRASHLRGALLCYAAAGWPEVFVALSWRRSLMREALVAERENFREARHASHHLHAPPSA